MITCRDISDTASDYLDGPTTFMQRFGLRFHLIVCQHCRRYVKQLNLASRVAQSVSSASEPTDEEIELLVEKLRQA